MLRRFVQHSALALFGVLGAVLLVEASLQIAALWTWRHAQRMQAAPALLARDGDHRRVLCVGDSFTYGEGAASPEMAYPNQLQRLLDASATGSWQVVNRGWPGRNSSELLQRLPGMLLRERPDYVCILIGNNNRWSHAEMNLPPPQLHTASGQDDQGWQWRWRTLRFLQLRYAAFGRYGDAAAPTRPPQTTSGPDESPPTGSAPDWNTPTGDSGEDLYAQLVKAKALLKQGDLTGVATVNRMVDNLRPQARAAQDYRAAELLLEILEKLRRHQDVIDEGRFSIEKYGKSAGRCGRLVEPLARLGRFREALAWADEAVGLQEPGHEQAWIYSARALVHLRMHHYDLSVRDSIRAFAIDADAERLQHALRKVLARKKPSALKTYVDTAELSLPEPLQNRVNVLVHRVVTESGTHKAADAPLKRKLEDDLRHMIALVKESGAQPVLLTYPNAGGGLNAVLSAVREVAGESGIPLVDVDPVFRDLLQHERHDRYFIADYHCNDAGYGIIAQQVAQVLIPLAGLHPAGSLYDTPDVTAQ